jgi:hypothetical protein
MLAPTVLATFQRKLHVSWQFQEDRGWEEMLQLQSTQASAGRESRLAKKPLLSHCGRQFRPVYDAGHWNVNIKLDAHYAVLDQSAMN